MPTPRAGQRATKRVARTSRVFHRTIARLIRMAVDEGLGPNKTRRAPEVRRGQTPAEPFAYEARDELIRLTRGRVGCRPVDRDRYGRIVAKCWSSDSPDRNAA